MNWINASKRLPHGEVGETFGARKVANILDRKDTLVYTELCLLSGDRVRFGDVTIDMWSPLLENYDWLDAEELDDDEANYDITRKIPDFSVMTTEDMDEVIKYILNVFGTSLTETYYASGGYIEFNAHLTNDKNDDSFLFFFRKSTPELIKALQQTDELYDELDSESCKNNQNDLSVDVDEIIKKELEHVHPAVRGQEFDCGFVAGGLAMYEKGMDDYDTIKNDKITRVEVIDHTPNGKGRVFSRYGIKEMELSYQDDDKTLKIFLK